MFLVFFIKYNFDEFSADIITEANKGNFIDQINGRCLTMYN